MKSNLVFNILRDTNILASLLGYFVASLHEFESSSLEDLRKELIEAIQMEFPGCRVSLCKENLEIKFKHDVVTINNPQLKQEGLIEDKRRING